MELKRSNTLYIFWRFVRGWGVAVVVVGLALVVVHTRIFANPTPTTTQLQEYLKTNRLFVGEETINGRRQVYYLFDNIQVLITNENTNHTSPVVSGHTVVWLEELNGTRQLVAYDVLTKQKTRLTFSGTHQNPHIDGQNITWEKWVNEMWQVMHYNGEAVKQISAGHSSIRSQLAGSKIAYAQQLKPGLWRTQLYDIVTGQTETAAQNSGKAAWPRFDGDQLVRGE